jgi:CHAT domain-containing protein
MPSHTWTARSRVVAALLLSATALTAQEQRPLSQADVARDMREAQRLLKERKTDEASAAFQRLIDAAHALGLETEEAEARCGLGETLNKRTRIVEARVQLQQCLETADRLQNPLDIARASLALSEAAELAGRYAEAVTFANRAIATYDALQNAHGRATARLELLRVSNLPADEAEALEDRIIEDARLLDDRVLEADALHQRGDRYFQADRFEEAFETLTRARTLYHDARAFDDEGTTLNSIGRVFRAHGRLDEALKCQQQALALHQQYGTPFELMQSHNAVAVVENYLGYFKDARNHYEQALAIARQSGSPRIQDFLNANIASLLIDQGEYEKGIRALEEVLGHGVDAFPSERYSNLSFAYLKENRREDSMAAAAKALETCHDEQVQCLDALNRRAAAYDAFGDDAAALADLHTALGRIEALRTKLVPADFIKQNFHESQRDVYSAAIAIAFKQHSDRESLETAEMASSRAFLDLLAARGGSSTAGEVLSSGSAKPSTAADLSAIASRLHSTAVVYWPTDDGLFVWVVHANGRIGSRQVNVSKARVVELIAATSSVAHSPGEEQSVHAVTTRGAGSVSAADPDGPQAWRELYDLLIAPIRDQLPRTPGALLTIIPHGVLTNVSFAALQNRDGRYLLEDYALHYAPAGAVLQFTAATRHSDARAGTALLVADPATVRQSPLDPLLPPLTGARQEVEQIAALIPRQRTTVLEGRSATEPRVVAAAATTSILHFATHAIVRDDAPNDSYLAFSPAADAPTGLLKARDVYDLRVNADLVVLSACRSGGGPVTGDGIATFARAFIYAGTPSLVVSLWDVADEPTSRMLPAFYRTWLAGSSKAGSLRHAQLQLLADLRAGRVRVDTKAGPVVVPERPVFWAGFVLIGEPQ